MVHLKTYTPQRYDIFLFFTCKSSHCFNVVFYNTTEDQYILMSFINNV